MEKKVMRSSIAVLFLSVIMLMGGLFLFYGQAEPAFAGGHDGNPDKILEDARAQNLPVATGDRSWTVAVYMCGSDLESKYGDATDDLIEMLQAQVEDESGLNLIVMTGGAGRNGWNPKNRQYDGYVTPKGTQYWQICGGRMHLLYEFDGYEDMGGPMTATQFFHFAYEYAPASQVATIFWDHGSGPLRGAEYPVDESGVGSTGTHMTMDDIITSIRNTNYFIKNKKPEFEKIDLVGFDCCLMGTLEIAHAMSSYADYMVASEELEPGEGWNYLWLRIFNESDINSTGSGLTYQMRTEAIGTRIVDLYMHPNNNLANVELGKQTWQNPNHRGTWRNCTLALVRLDRMPAVMNKLSEFGTKMWGYYVARFSIFNHECYDFRKFLKAVENMDYLDKGDENQVDAYTLFNTIRQVDVDDNELKKICGDLIDLIGHPGKPIDGGGLVGHPANYDPTYPTAIVYRGVASDRAKGTGVGLFFAMGYLTSPDIHKLVTRGVPSDESGGSIQGAFDDLPLADDPAMANYVKFIKNTSLRSDEVVQDILQANKDKSGIYMTIREGKDEHDIPYNEDYFNSVSAGISAAGDGGSYYLGDTNVTYNEDKSRYEVDSRGSYKWLAIDNTPITADQGPAYRDYYLPALVEGSFANPYEPGEEVPVGQVIPEEQISKVHIYYDKGDCYILDWKDQYASHQVDMLDVDQDTTLRFNPVIQEMKEDGTPGDYIARPAVTAKAGPLMDDVNVCFIDGVTRNEPVGEGEDERFMVSFTAFDNDMTPFTTNSVETDKDSWKTGENPLKKGMVFKYGGNTYTVASVKRMEASLKKAKNAKTVVIPDLVKCEGIPLNVVGIAPKAFKKSKARTVVVKAFGFSKSRVKDAFKGSKVKTVKIKYVSRKDSKRLLKKYRKFFTKKNLGKKVKIRL